VEYIDDMIQQKSVMDSQTRKLLKAIGKK